MPRGDLFPEIGPFETGYLPLSDEHVMYWEQVGNPPAMGGPFPITAIGVGRSGTIFQVPVTALPPGPTLRDLGSFPPGIGPSGLR